MEFILNNINKLIYSTTPIFYKILYMSIIGSLIGAVILLLRKILDKKISPKWKCIIWSILIISLLVPIKIENKSKNISTLNITGMAEPIQQVSYREEYNNMQQELENQIQKTENENYQEIQELKQKVDETHIKTILFDMIIPSIWLLGVLGYSILLIIGNKNINRKIKNNVYYDMRIEGILKECKNNFRIKRNIKLMLQDFKKTPCILGILKPKILITESLLKNNHETIKHILMHELAHYKRKDNLLNCILLVTTIVHWFNPFIWIFFKKVRQDIELATDELVIKHLGENDKKSYGLTLINSLKSFQEEKHTARLLCITSDSKNMERRIKMIKLSDKFSKNKVIIAIISILIMAVVVVMFFTKNIEENKEVSENTSIQNNNEMAKCQYKSFKPIFKKSENSEYDDYDYTQDMEYQDSIYHRKINNYKEYSEVKSRWNEILDMNETDFENNFMVITAVENTSMLGLNVDKIETDNNTLYISLKREKEDGTDIESLHKTCISYIIPRSMEREKILCVRNYTDEEKDFSKEMQIAEIKEENSSVLNYQYKNKYYRQALERSMAANSNMHIIEQNWKDMIYSSFTITKDMPDINFNNWQNLGNDFYCLAITDYSEYAKLMNNYNTERLSWFDFEYIYALVIVRANSDNSIGIDEITTDENGNSYLPVYPSAWLDVTEEFKYPGMVVILPNYMSLKESNFQAKLK